MKTYLGIDVGSISTNFVLIDEEAKILSSLYLRTEGNPIGSIQRGLGELKKDVPENAKISGVGTTGSARYLAGVVTGADLIKNEITAHAKGASFFVPDVRTVIEIGGQDSKIIILENGVVVDFAMNLICLTKDTKLTAENYLPKPINEIKVGEKVLTHKGRFKKVKQIFETNYHGEIIKTECSNLKTLKITPEHPVLALKREDIECYQSYSRKGIVICKPPDERSCNKSCAKCKKFSWEPKFIPAKGLRVGDFIASPLSLENEMDDPIAIAYSIVKTEPKIFRPFKAIHKFVFKPDLLRLLGYYLAEGSLQYNEARWNKKVKYPSGVIFVFNIDEENYIEDIKKIFSRNFNGINVKIGKNPQHHTATISVYSKCLAEYIKYLCGSGADKKRLSTELLNLEPSLQKEILKGFFRGDGQLRKRLQNTLGLDKRGNRYCSSTVSEALAHQLYWLLLRNKIKAKIRKSSNKTKGGKYAYFIEIFGKEINKLEDQQLVNPKKQGYKSFIYLNWLFEPIRKIKKYNFKGKVYNLEVEDDNTYVSNTVAVHNCAAGTGSFLDAQAFRLQIPVEEFGELALKSKNPTDVAGRCTIFAESDMIHKQQVGHSVEDIVSGLCHALVRNYLNNVAKGKTVKPPIVFQGGVSENIGMRKAFEEALGEKIIVPEYNLVMGAFGAALIVKGNVNGPTKFRGWEISDQNIKCTSFQCNGCPNQCEVIEARIEGKVVSRWNDRCGKWSGLNPDI